MSNMFSNPRPENGQKFCILEKKTASERQILAFVQNLALSFFFQKSPLDGQILSKIPVPKVAP